LVEWCWQTRGDAMGTWGLHLAEIWGLLFGLHVAPVTACLHNAGFKGDIAIRSANDEPSAETAPQGRGLITMLTFSMPCVDVLAMCQ